MNSLYDLTNEMIRIDEFLEMDFLDETEREKAEEYKKAIEELIEIKTENIVKYVRNLESNTDLVDIEIKRLSDIKQKNKNKIERLKNIILERMKTLNINKLETSLGNVSRRKNPVSVEVVDEKMVPAEYKKIEQVIKIDKKAITNLFKETGELIEGIKMITDKESVMIK